MFLYRLCDKNGIILYIGKTKSINNRISQHRRNKKFTDIDYVEYIEIENISDIEILEIYMINHYKPKFNKEFSKGKDSTNFVLPENFDNIKWSYMVWDINKIKQEALKKCIWLV